MAYDFFYGQQSELFSFFRIPKALFTDPRFKDLSAEAKILYGILLDRMSLSSKNGWFDSLNRVYIIFTTEEVMSAMSCADNKATKLMGELEKKAGLIERKRQGLGKPNLIYVKNFTSYDDEKSEENQGVVQNRDFHDSGIVNSANQESLKSRCNNTDINDTDNKSIPFSSGAEGSERIEARMMTEERIKYNLDFNDLLLRHPYEKETLEGILTIMTDICCTRKAYIRVGGEEKPAEVVKGQFMKLKANHIEFVLHCLHENTTRIRDPKQYLTATLYNAPLTIDSYYQSWVNSSWPNQKE